MIIKKLKVVIYLVNDKVLINELYPLIEKGLSKKENVMKFKQSVSNYIDRNSDKLSTIGPIHRTIFSEEDMNNLYNVIEVSPVQIKEIIKKSKVIKDQWQIMNDPFNSACCLTIRYFRINKNDDMANLALIYLTLSMYPSLHYKFFEFEPNENIMNFTINNLSNKFKIKQTGSIHNALIATSFVSDKKYNDNLLKGSDKEIVDYVQAINTRLNMLMRKISNEFYKNHKDKKYMNLESDNFEEATYHESDSNIYAVERMTNAVVLKLTVDGPNIKIVNLASKFCQVSTSELRNYIETLLVQDKREEIRTIVDSILFLFLFDSQNTVQEVASNKFFFYCLELYKKSNTSDKNIIKIKQVLDGWLEELGTYKKTQRLATINNFRRALFTFFVASIQHINS